MCYLYVYIQTIAHSMRNLIWLLNIYVAIAVQRVKVVHDVEDVAPRSWNCQDKKIAQDKISVSVSRMCTCTWDWDNFLSWDKKISLETASWPRGQDVWLAIFLTLARIWYPGTFTYATAESTGEATSFRHLWAKVEPPEFFLCWANHWFQRMTCWSKIGPPEVCDPQHDFNAKIDLCQC